MKLGFIANNSLDGLRADCQLAQVLGYRGLEFNYWGDFANLTDDTVAQQKAIIDEFGIECSTFGIWGFNHISPDAAEREKCHAAFERAIGYAQVLGAPVLITGGGRFVEGEIQPNVDEYARVMPRLLDQAAEAGLKVCLYGFHGGSFLDTIDGYEALWEKVPNVGLKCDPANIDHAGQDYLRMLKDHGDRVYHVHLKEHLNYGGAVVSQPAVGMGDIQWGKVFAFLYEADFLGYLTVEPHGPKWSRGALHDKMLALTKKYVSQFLL